MTNSSGPTAIAPPTEPPPLGPRHARPAPARLSTARAAVLRMLAVADGAVTVTVLAEQLGQHPNTVREHLDALVTDGRAKRTRSAPAGRGRPAWLYRAIHDAEGPADGTTDAMLGDAPFAGDGDEYIALAVALIDQVSDSSPDPRDLARRAGERWGRTLAARRRTPVDSDPRRPGDAQAQAPGTADGRALNAVVGILRDLRFEPRADRDPKTVRLTTCPFLDAARRHPDVVCQIHLGIVRGALERLGGDPESADLRAFAEPGACLLHLSDVR